MPFIPKVVEDFIGKGITFPIQLNRGRAVVNTGFELIKSSIEQIIFWPLGTRYYLAEFGSRMNELEEEPNDNVLINLLSTFVIDAIPEWETRVQILSVEWAQTGTMGEGLSVKITGKLINSQTPFTHIFPFYSQTIT